MTEQANNEQQVVDTIKLPVDASVSHADMTDDDLKHLVIYYATIIRNPKNCNAETVKQVTDAWSSWPKELRDRFHELVLTEAQTANGRPFWSRPADNNIRYGV